MIDRLVGMALEAGKAILRRAAGGSVTGLEGAPVRYGKHSRATIPISPTAGSSPAEA